VELYAGSCITWWPAAIPGLRGSSAGGLTPIASSISKPAWWPPGLAGLDDCGWRGPVCARGAAAPVSPLEGIRWARKPGGAWPVQQVGDRFESGWTAGWKTPLDDPDPASPAIPLNPGPHGPGQRSP